MQSAARMHSSNTIVGRRLSHMHALRLGSALTAIGLTLGLPSLALAQTQRIGVVGIGADATNAGALQYRLEQALSAQKITIVPSAELALRLAARGSTETVRDDGSIALLLAETK